MAQETIPELLQQIRKQRFSKQDNYLSLGEIVKLKYNGHTVNVSDLAIKLKNNALNNVSLIKIIKKRAAYQQYLLNRQRKKEEAQKASITFPKIEFPQIEFPTLEMPYGNGNPSQNSNDHKTKNQRQRW
ncbi:MAG: hypothetical protein QW478_04055 [Candidatus Micrarchaeaceae archaeon]